MKEGKWEGKWICRLHTREFASSRNGDSFEVHHQDCDLACRSLASDEELDGNEEVIGCRRDLRNDC